MLSDKMFQPDLLMDPEDILSLLLVAKGGDLDEVPNIAISTSKS
eukprot:Gb_18787 [translate_table: standard]